MKLNQIAKKKIEEIHLSLINGQKRQMVKLIDRYGTYDFFEDYRAFIDNNHENIGFFVDATVAYHKIKGPPKSMDERIEHHHKQWSLFKKIRIAIYTPDDELMQVFEVNDLNSLFRSDRTFKQPYRMAIFKAIKSSNKILIYDLTKEVNSNG